MRNVKLTIEYDGTGYQGWQLQGDSPTVQKVFEDAIPKVVQHPVKVTGSGRTDSGVHAVGQVANFTTVSSIPPGQLLRAINYYLPRDIAVVAAEDVALDFHARYSARSKTYRYRVLNREAPSPLLRFRAFHVFARLDVDAMRQGAQHLIGEHDFAAFQSKAAETDMSSVRNITQLEIEQAGDLIDFWVSSNGFLYNMVRAIAGTLIDAGLRRFSPADVLRILESRDRSQAGPTAPANGLCLMQVLYDPSCPCSEEKG